MCDKFGGMELVHIPDNPIPPGAVLHGVKAGRVTLRVARWGGTEAGGHSPGTVVVLPGRSEFIEKYAEVVGELRDRGFCVVVVDWRGQGGSSRLLRNPYKGHVRHFDDYRVDLDAVAAQVLGPHCPRPWFALAHSMGGAILIDHAARGHCPFERVVLSAPMIGIYGLRMERAVRAIAATAAHAGLGRTYIPGGSNRSWMSRPFAGNGLTSDERRFAIFNALAEAAPRLVLGAPTMGWLHAAFRVMRAISRADVAQRLDVPMLIIGCGVDRVVATPAIERFAARLRLGQCIVVTDALHEVLMERDELRGQFWAAFDAFVPGSNGRAADRRRAEPRLETAG
jgi:lysophospholipase